MPEAAELALSKARRAECQSHASHFVGNCVLVLRDPGSLVSGGQGKKAPVGLCWSQLFLGCACLLPLSQQPCLPAGRRARLWEPEALLCSLELGGRGPSHPRRELARAGWEQQGWIYSAHPGIGK